MTERSRPLHVLAFLGLSAGAYAASLAAVTVQQAQSEAAVTLDRAPTTQAIGQISAGHDALAAAADRATAAYDRAVSGYDALGRTLADVEAQLADLSGTVGTIEGAAKGLPSRVALPATTRVVSRTVVQAAAPTVHATTGASGG